MSNEMANEQHHQHGCWNGEFILDDDKATSCAIILDLGLMGHSDSCTLGKLG